MNILYITTISNTLSFFKSIIPELIHEGHRVDIASSFNNLDSIEFFRSLGCVAYELSCSRKPIDRGNIKCIGEIKKIVQNGEYDIIHCHTPIAAACTRIACKSLRKNGVRVIYTAHGFHFYSGAPIKNWLIFYPVEWICAHWTDVLITINKEDYERAKKHMHAKKVEYVPGVGIDVEKFANTVVDRGKKRSEIGVPEEAFMLLSVGELNENKNHQIVIKALGEINDSNNHYVIAGVGNQKEALEKLAKELNVNLHLLGYRNDVAELYKCADVYILPSLREGLNVSVMEAMASGLLCIVSKIRGNSDLIDSGNNGYLFKQNDVKSLAECLKMFIDNNDIISMHGSFKTNKIKSFDRYVVLEKMKRLYFAHM